jgi:predicted pyridoxine 5'-phosphate oxidase superfamily flavin-nucleotide-binding protein
MGAAFDEAITRVRLREKHGGERAVQARHQVNGKAPALALAVTVTEAFMHCSKAFVRGRLWKSEQWPDLVRVPTLAD